MTDEDKAYKKAFEEAAAIIGVMIVAAVSGIAVVITLVKALAAC